MGLESTWKGRLLAVVDLFQRVDWRDSIRGVYQQIASELIGIASCDSVSIRLLALTGDEMIGYVYAGEAEVLARAQFPTLPASVGRMAQVFEERAPLVYDFNAPEAADVRSEDGLRLGYSHAVVVPMLSGDAPVGAIDFMFKTGQYDGSADQLLFLTELGRLLGTVSSTLSIADEVFDRRVSEEAKRIGSELHDNFAQPLSVIALEADKAILCQEDGDAPRLAESLKRISDLSRQSFDLMANEVALLHSASGMSENLLVDIRRYVENFKRQWGIDIRLDAPLGELVVSKSVGNQVMRILHEALSNVLRHAHADHVVVTVASARGALELNIEDDGRGFNVRDVSTRQLGLKIMEERARCVGGRLTVASVIGEGTSVFADLPLVA